MRIISHPSLTKNIMEVLKSKGFWFSMLGVALLIGLFIYLSGDSAKSEDASNTPSTTPPQNKKTLKTYFCETKKVCQARTGYTNWVKTGNQTKCNCTNVCQGLCINDCKGTCYTWE